MINKYLFLWKSWKTKIYYGIKICIYGMTHIKTSHNTKNGKWDLFSRRIVLYCRMQWCDWFQDLWNVYILFYAFEHHWKLLRIFRKLRKKISLPALLCLQCMYATRKKCNPTLSTCIFYLQLLKVYWATTYSSPPRELRHWSARFLVKPFRRASFALSMHCMRLSTCRYKNRSFLAQ